jgi:hypothetical protein
MKKSLLSCSRSERSNHWRQQQQGITNAFWHAAPVGNACGNTHASNPDHSFEHSNYSFSSNRHSEAIPNGDYCGGSDGDSHDDADDDGRYGVTK